MKVTKSSEFVKNVSRKYKDMVRLKEKFNKEIAPALMKELGCKNRMAVPKITKVVLNVGFGKMIAGKTGSEQEKIYKSISNDLAQITGQKPVLTKSKKAIAGFKTRQGMILGAMVTLRGEKMYSFLERLMGVAYPRSRDFQGIDTKSFDKNGNLSVALKEQTVFSEVELDHAKLLFSFEITIATTAKNREEGIKLLKSIGFPLKSSENNQ